MIQNKIYFDFSLVTINAKTTQHQLCNTFVQIQMFDIWDEMLSGYPLLKILLKSTRQVQNNLCVCWNMKPEKENQEVYRTSAKSENRCRRRWYMNKKALKSVYWSQLQAILYYLKKEATSYSLYTWRHGYPTTWRKLVYIKVYFCW